MIKGASKDIALQSAPAEAFEPLGIEELRGQEAMSTLQGTLADILLDHALDGLWDDALELRLREELRDAWGDEDLLRPLLRASTGHYAIGSSASSAVMTCSCLKTLDEENELSPATRFHRDLHLVVHVASSIGRRALESRIVTRLETGWQRVLEHQRFAISAPGRNAQLIDRALQYEAAYPSPATSKQQWFLRRHGAWVDGMSKRDAMHVIGELKAHQAVACECVT